MRRIFWERKILSLIEDRSILWIAGVRRSGKTTLCKNLPNIQYFDCELPRVRAALEDVENFLDRIEKGTIVLDEIHRLTNPSEILKVAADHYPKINIIATGSSTLAAKSKFKDTLTGRKNELWLLPSIFQDLKDFGIKEIDTRILRGGLPLFLLSEKLKDENYLEWMDSYWAKDIQELFNIEKRASFMKCIELVMRQSGQLFEAQAFSSVCEISRQTVQNYLSVLEITCLVSILRPFSDGSAIEIKSQPKVYAFDTGFCCFFRGISTLSNEDRGNFLEHLVYGELLSIFSRSQIFYWRNKSKLEIDFVVKPNRSNQLVAIECKSSYKNFSPDALYSFREKYPKGKNIVVAFDINKQVIRQFKKIDVVFCSPWDLIQLL